MLTPSTLAILAALGLPNPEEVHLPTDVVTGWVRYGSDAGDNQAGLDLGTTTVQDLSGQYACKSKAILETFQGGTATDDPKYVGIIAAYRVVVSATNADDADAGDSARIQDYIELANAQYIHHKMQGGGDRYLDCTDCIVDPMGAVAVATGNAANDLHAAGRDPGGTNIAYDPMIVDFHEDTIETAAQGALSNSHTFQGFVEFFGLFVPRAAIIGPRGKAQRDGGADKDPAAIRAAVLRFLTQNAGKTASPGA